MSPGSIVKRGTVALVTAAFTTGCATHSSGGKAGASYSPECDQALAVGIGAVVGGLLASGNNRLRGAAVGAGIASLACMAWNYQSKQTKTAEQVQREYKTANRDMFPANSKVVRYDTRFDPTNRITPGSLLTITSNIEVLQGHSDATTPVVEEEISLVKPDGSEVRTRKPANEGGGAGGYQTRFTMTMPEGVRQGIYPIRTALYLNGQRTDEKSLSLQVVRVGDEWLALRVR